MPTRIQRRRTAGWRAPLDAQGRPPIYVGRPSRWGNPYPANGSVEERAFATARFAHLLASRATHPHPEHVTPYPSDEEIRHALAGRDLMCWCPAPEPGWPDHCHGAVLLRLAAGEPL